MDISSDFRVVSYNILNPRLAVRWNTEEGLEYTPKGKVDNWNTRKEHLVNNLLKAQFSVACLQEVDREIIMELTSGNEKHFVSPLFSPNIPKRGRPHEGVSLFYNSAKVTLIWTKIFKSLSKGSCSKGELFGDFSECRCS
jgi:hypothetical protein